MKAQPTTVQNTKCTRV